MKIIKLLLLLLFINFIITGCWNSREINTLAITICVGIDKAEKGYKVTQQILNPKVITSKKATNEPAVVLYVEEGDDIFEINRKITKQCPRKIYYSHLRMVVLGEDVAKDGIEKILDFFSRDHEYRTDFYFIIAKGTTANNILSNLTALESVPGIEMFNSLMISEDVWAPTKSVKIIELINSIVADGKNPVLTGVELTNPEEITDSTESLKKINLNCKIKYTGLGAFKKDSFIGWLSDEESKGYNYIMGNVASTVGFVDLSEFEKVTFEVKKAKSEIKAYLLNGKPAIKVDIFINTNVGSVSGNIDVSKEENMEILCKMFEENILSICSNALNKIQKDLRTDIFGFGEKIHRAYPDLWVELKKDWNDKFVNIPVNIDVNVNIDQLGQVTKSYYSKGTD